MVDSNRSGLRIGMPVDILVQNALDLEERQTYRFKVGWMNWGGRDGNVTDRQAVARTGGLEDGLKDGRTN